MGWLVAPERNSNRRTNETKPVCIPSAELPSQLLYRLGFRTPAWREHSRWWRVSAGRRPKASEERTRGTAASSWPAMGILLRGGAGRRSFCADWWEVGREA